MATLDTLYALAVDRIEEHNSFVEEKSKINSEVFLKSVKELGATNPTSLASLSFEEISSCFNLSSEIRIPTILAKDIAKIWRSEKENVKTNNFSDKKAEKMSLNELVQNFNPDDLDSAISRRLEKLSNNNPFIVYETGKHVDVTTTISLLEEIKKGFPPRTIFMKNGDAKKVYKVTETPDNFIAENPFYPSRPLRPLDESCDQSNRSWAGIDLESRQLVRIAVDMKLLTVNLENINNTLDLILSEKGKFIKKFTQRYPTASIKFHELKAQGALPNLVTTIISSPNLSSEMQLRKNPVSL